MSVRRHSLKDLRRKRKQIPVALSSLIINSIPPVASLSVPPVLPPGPKMSFLEKRGYEFILKVGDEITYRCMKHKHIHISDIAEFKHLGVCEDCKNRVFTQNICFSS